MNLSLNKRENMKKIGLILFCIILNSSLFAQEDKEVKNIDKLDALDKQSKEFFKAITGLENEYLTGQIKEIQSKKDIRINNTMNNQGQLNNSNIPIQPEITPEDYEKNVFKHQNELARLTTDFTRTKKLKDLKIKSMYSFNGKDYVVLKLENTSATNTKDELSSNIEGRYLRGDYILGHKITSVNIRTKSIELYKKLDEEHGYSIYLSNYGISVSDLKKIEKVDEVKNEKIVKPNVVVDKNEKIKEAFKDVETNTKSMEKNLDKKLVSQCLYTVNVQNLNVRNSKNLDATILRILKINDQFTIKQKNGDWVEIDTIYKKISGDVMVVENENNWLQIADENVRATNNNCL